MQNTGLTNSLVRYNDAYSTTWIEYLGPRAWRGHVNVEFRHVPMSQIDAAGCGINWQTLEGWYLALLHGRPIPPIVVHETEHGRYYAHDGNHRLEALAHFFGGEAERTLVRVAIARPRRGWVFHRVAYQEYATYLLSPDGAAYEPGVVREPGAAENRAV